MGGVCRGRLCRLCCRSALRRHELGGSQYLPPGVPPGSQEDITYLVIFWIIGRIGSHRDRRLRILAGAKCLIMEKVETFEKWIAYQLSGRGDPWGVYIYESGTYLGFYYCPSVRIRQILAAGLYRADSSRWGWYLLAIPLVELYASLSTSLEPVAWSTPSRLACSIPIPNRFPG